MELDENQPRAQRSDSLGNSNFADNMEVKDNSYEDPDTCRICRGEGTDEEQLFYPCKCSGSIKFVHQACLVEWLSHSQKKYCELCKTPFRFTKLYDPNMPQELPAPLFMRQLSIHGFRTVLTWLRLFLVAFVWLGWLPWSMRAIWRALFWLADGRWSVTEILRKQALTHLHQLVANGTITMDAVQSAIGTARSAAAAPSPTTNLPTQSSGSLATPASEPVVLSLAKKALPTLLLPGNSADKDPMIWELTNVTMHAAKLRHPSWLSDVRFLNSLTSSPTINKILIDTLEGQLITLFVVVSFILIFLIREWVVQQQPMANIAEGEREAAVQLIANNRPNREPEPAHFEQEPRPDDAAGPRADSNNGEQDTEGGELNQSEPHGVARSFESDGPVDFRNVPAEGSSSSAVPTDTADDGSEAVRNFGETPSDLEHVWSGIELFRDIWSRGNGDIEEVSRIIREEGRQGELDRIIQTISGHQSHQTPADHDPAEPSTSRDGAADFSDGYAAEDGHVTVPESGESLPASSQDGLSYEHAGTPNGLPAEFSEIPSPDNPNTSSSRHDLAFDVPESMPEGITSHQHGVTEPSHSPSNNENPTNQDINSNGGPNMVSEPPQNTRRPAPSESAGPRQKTLVQSVSDWFWADIVPDSSAQEHQQHQNDEQVIEDPALEAPFIPVRNNQRIANAGMQEEQDVAPIAADGEIDANDVEAAEEGDDLEGIMELIGVQGPIFGLLQNAVFSALLISITVALGIWLPYVWGKIAVVVLANPVQLFFGVPMAAVSIAADVALDTLIGSLGYVIYAVSLICRVLFGPLDSFVPVKDWIPRTGSVTSASLSLIDASSRRLGKVVNAFFHESDIPIFSVLSHQALKMHEARVISAFRTVYLLNKFVLYDLPLRIISLGSREVLVSNLRSLDLPNDFGQFKQLCSFGASYILSTVKTSLGLGHASLAEVPLDYGLAVWDTKDRVIAIVMGYALATIVGLTYLRVTGLFVGVNREQRVGGFVAETLGQAGGVMKVILIIGIEMILFPLYCGSLLDLALLPLFDKVSIASRLEFTASSPTTSLFVHWFIGTCYMFHFALFVSMCRKIMRTGVLYFIRDPDDPTFHPVRDVLERNITTQLRKIAFSALVYGALVIVCLGGVVWGLDFAFDGILPIHWSSTVPVLEFPIDLLFYNFVVPLVIRSIKPSDGLHNMFDWWFHKCARLLRLTDFFFGERKPDEEGWHVRRTWTDALLLKQGDVSNPVVDEGQRAHAEKQGLGPYFLRDGKFVRAPASDQVRIPKGNTVFLEVTENNERVDGAPDRNDGLHGRISGMFKLVYIPPSFRMRIAAFILSIWVFTASIGLGSTIIPLIVGRKILASYFPSHMPVNDVYAISVGLCPAGIIAYAVFHCREAFAVVKNRLRPYLQSPRETWLGFSRTVLDGLRLAYIFTAFSILLPSFLAMAIELYVLVPLHTYFDSGRAYSINFIQDWTLGVLYFHMAAKFVLWNSNLRPAAALRATFREGWLRPNVKVATRGFILPATLLAVVLTVLPMIIGFTFNLAMSQSVPKDVPVKIYRYSYPATFAIGFYVYLAGLIRRQVETWRVNIRDDVYLIGERLHNFSEKRAKDVDVPRRVITG